MFLPPLLEHSGVGILLMDVRGMVVVMVVGWGGGVLKSVPLLPVPLQIAETRIFFSFFQKKGRKPAAYAALAGFFFLSFFHSCFTALWRVDVLLRRLTVTQQSSRASISERQAQSGLKRAVQQPCVCV